MAAGLSFLSHSTHGARAAIKASGVVALLRRWARRWRTRRALASLPPRLLADVGLDHRAAMDEALKPFWRG